MTKIGDVKGYTLLEVLIALAITTFVTTGVYEFYLSQQRSYLLQDMVAEMYQNARVSIDRMARDLRLAGLGIPSWEANAIDVTDGGVNPDSVTIVAASGAATGTFSAAASPGNTTLTVSGASDFNPGDDIFIGHTGENARVVSRVGSDLTIDTDPSAGGNQGLVKGYPASTPVYKVKRIAYEINNNILRRREGSGSNLGNYYILAENVTDFQFTPAADGQAYYTITLTGRTARVDPSTKNYRTVTLRAGVKVRNM